MKHLVWEIPVRIFHWSLATVFVVAWFTQDDQALFYHVLAGYIFSGLLIFRLLWGFKGEHYSKFKHFIYTPAQTLNYIRSLFQQTPQPHIGHNPAGSWAIFLILTLGFIIAATGLITLGAEELHGPLKGWFDIKTGISFHFIHKYAALLLVYVIVFHVLGVISESYLHRENLVLAMINGKKNINRSCTPVPVRQRTKLAMLIILSIMLFSTWWFYPVIINNNNFEYPYALPSSDTWNEECGSCHLAYFPGLLPERSWKKILAEQGNHFSEDLSLDEESLTTLENFASKVSRPPLLNEASWRIQTSIKTQDTPIRITKTSYWLEKHKIIPEATWNRENISGRFNCDACHRDASEGWFDDIMISYE